jgi:PLP dependent protein
MMAVQPDARRDVPAQPAEGDGAMGAQVDAALQDRLRDVRGRMHAAAQRAGRMPSSVVLVAVSKTVDPEIVLAARRLGQSDFGESRAQELRRKHRAAGPGLRWHFVGRLQRNKVRDVVGVASLIHSVGTIELAGAIAERARKEQRMQRILVQVNIGDDPAKGGCAPEDLPGLVARVRGLDGVACEGLMTIPPLGVDPRPLFRRLREARDDLRERFPEVQHLSMGMSADFEVAVEEGATIVRVGEAVFGPRPAAANAAG